MNSVTGACSSCRQNLTQLLCAKKVLSDRPGLVNFFSPEFFSGKFSLCNKCKVRNNILGASENDLGVVVSENWFSLHTELGAASYLLSHKSFDWLISLDVDIVLILNANA